ncbi:MAG TPA: DNA replication and repair protein RecF [Anaerolineales bacterium]|nr:DNA replication and repair protein RecF [Anaerolineales bacterium]
MLLAHLSLSNFRNFIRLESALPAGTTLVLGANAQGKTSLLEAIHYLVAADSPHAAQDRQLINFLALAESTPVARLVGEVHRADRILRVEIRLVLEKTNGEEPRLRKDVLLNGVRRRVGDLAGVFNAVLFLPEDLQVLEGPPAERRRYLDLALSQADPQYAASLAEYGRVITQRNALLKQLSDQAANGDQLEFWDRQAAEAGASLFRGRALAVRELETLAAPVHAELTRGAESLRLEYLPALPAAVPGDGQLGLPLAETTDWTGLSHAAWRDRLSTALARMRPDDVLRGSTLVGPHRDELRLLSNGIDLRPYGSRGQNRTAMISLKLAEVEWLRQRTGEWPVLLLDEVLAELDQDRRRDLLARVSQSQQALLTSTDESLFDEEFRRRSTIWRIRAGQLEPASPGLSG